jgi:hypothetical protein
MKFLLALALLTSVAFGQEHEMKNEEHKAEAAKTEKVGEKKEDKRAAYKQAKNECLKENKDLKGKELTKCIVSKNK